MIQTIMLTRIRAILKEITPGYFLDTELYGFMDSGQNRVIQLALAKELMGRADEYKSPVLIPLITLDTSNTTTIGSGYQEYTLPADFLATYIATYSVSTGGVKYPCVLKDFSEGAIAQLNTFEIEFKKPFVYVRAEKLGFFPQPTGAGANNYAHYYYKQPTAVASGQDFTLREETHEAIMEWALYQALQELKEYDKASSHLNNFILTIQGLV